MAIGDRTSTKDANGIQAFWKRTMPVGVPVLYTPTELVEGAIKYFDWCHNNPLYEMDIRSTKDDGIVETPVAKMRAFTNQGLATFLGISLRRLNAYKANPEYEEAADYIDQVMYAQKFEGAAAGLLNPTVITRDLGLADNVKQQHTSPDGSMTPKASVNWALLDTATLDKIEQSGVFNALRHINEE